MFTAAGDASVAERDKVCVCVCVCVCARVCLCVCQRFSHSPCLATICPGDWHQWVYRRALTNKLKQAGSERSHMRTSADMHTIISARPSANKGTDNWRCWLRVKTCQEPPKLPRNYFWESYGVFGKVLWRRGEKEMHYGWKVRRCQTACRLIHRSPFDLPLFLSLAEQSNKTIVHFFFVVLTPFFVRIDIWNLETSKKHISEYSVKDEHKKFIIEALSNIIKNQVSKSDAVKLGRPQIITLKEAVPLAPPTGLCTLQTFRITVQHQDHETNAAKFRYRFYYYAKMSWERN